MYDTRHSFRIHIPCQILSILINITEFMKSHPSFNTAPAKPPGCEVKSANFTVVVHWDITWCTLYTQACKQYTDTKCHHMTKYLVVSIQYRESTIHFKLNLKALLLLVTFAYIGSAYRDIF